MNLTRWVMVLMLTICAVEDVKEQAVAMPLVYGFGVVGLLIQGYQKNETIWSVMGGIGIGIFIMIISHLTKGGVGMGDGIMLSITGVFLGVKENFMLLSIALMGVMVWSIILIVTKKITSKKEIPFIPFMLAAYLGMLML